MLRACSLQSERVREQQSCCTRQRLSPCTCVSVPAHIYTRWHNGPRNRCWIAIPHPHKRTVSDRHLNNPGLLTLANGVHEHAVYDQSAREPAAGLHGNSEELSASCKPSRMHGLLPRRKPQGGANSGRIESVQRMQFKRLVKMDGTLKAVSVRRGRNTRTTRNAPTGTPPIGRNSIHPVTTTAPSTAFHPDCR